MFDKCSQKYKDLLNLYGDLNVYNTFNINFMTVTADIINDFDPVDFQKKRYICFLDDVDIIKSKHKNLRFIIGNSVLTFTPYEIVKITGWMDRFAFFNPIFDESQYNNLNLGERIIETVNYDENQSYTIDYLNTIKFVNFNTNLNSNDYFINKKTVENVLNCLLCGCIVNSEDPNLLSILPDYVRYRINKNTFDYDYYRYSITKILENYSYMSSINCIDNTIIGIFGNPYVIVE